MAITKETIRLITGQRIQIDKILDPILRDTVRDWARGWNAIAGEWAFVAGELSNDEGVVLTQSMIDKSARVARALQITGDELDTLLAAVGDRAVGELPRIATLAMTTVGKVLDSQTPKGYDMHFARRVDRRQITAIVDRCADGIISRFIPVAEQTLQVIKSNLITGIGSGLGAKEVARRMVRNVENSFNFTMARAMNISRTELLDAHRTAAKVQEMMDEDVLDGWEWQTNLDTKTCGACWAMNGRRFPIEEDGPNDHPSGRCTRLPVLKPWKELGIDVKEPKPFTTDAEAEFWKLSREDRQKIMGIARQAALEAGEITWDDLVTMKDNPDWRPAIRLTPMNEIG